MKSTVAVCLSVSIILCPVLAMKQEFIDQQCATTVPDCVATQGSVCCGMDPKKSVSWTADTCGCSGASGSNPQSNIDGSCNNPSPNCSAKKAECCGMSPKQHVGSSNGNCMCFASDDGGSIGGAKTTLTAGSQESVDAACARAPPPACYANHSEVCCAMVPKQWHSYIVGAGNSCSCNGALVLSAAMSQSNIDSMCASPPPDCSAKEAVCCGMTPKQATVGIGGKCECAATTTTDTTTTVTGTTAPPNTGVASSADESAARSCLLVAALALTMADH